MIIKTVYNKVLGEVKNFEDEEDIKCFLVKHYGYEREELYIHKLKNAYIIGFFNRKSFDGKNKREDCDCYVDDDIVYKRRKLSESFSHKSLDNLNGDDKILTDDEYKKLVIEDNIVKNASTDIISTSTLHENSHENIFQIYGCPDDVYFYYKNLLSKERVGKEDNTDNFPSRACLENIEIKDKFLDNLKSNEENAKLFDRIFKAYNFQEDDNCDSLGIEEFDFEHLNERDKIVINKNVGKILKRKYGS